MTTKFSLLKEGDGTAFAPHYGSVIVTGLSLLESGAHRVTPPEASDKIAIEHIERLIAQLKEVQKEARKFLKP
jgi:hypothetical protein